MQNTVAKVGRNALTACQYGWQSGLKLSQIIENQYDDLAKREFTLFNEPFLTLNLKKLKALK